MALPRTPGQRIRAVRKNLPGKPKIETAASAIGISRAHLNMIELDKTLPGREALVAIADYLKVSVNYLLHGGDATPEPPQTSEVIDDPDELALLRFWRGLSVPERRRALNILRAGFEP